MATPSARIGLQAHANSTRLKFPELVAELVKVIGRKLTAYIASVDVRSVDRWVAGSANPYGNVDVRLRFTHQLIMPIADRDKPPVVQSWLTGINPELQDRTPIRLLREQDLEIAGPELLGAARAFLAGG